MKVLLIIILLTCSMNLTGQVRNFNDIPKDIIEQLDKMGVDDSLLLNSSESDFFNVVFKDSSKIFDFSHKKIGFVTEGSKKHKKDFFNEERERYFDKLTTINGTLYIFNDKQKEESGGYDAAIVYWSKFVIPVEKIVKILSEKH